MEHGIELEALLRDAGWLRRLAGRLVGEGGADDLAQETWLAALRRPPRSVDGRRPWLARVARNLAVNTRRGTARRAAREREQPMERGEPTPDELAQAAEAQRLVAEAVTNLAPPLRAAIVLSYYRGLDSRTAAAELGVPASTLRTRLQRALEELRAELDRKRGRESWMMLLVPLARGAGGTVVAAGFSGALVLAVLVGASFVGVLAYATWSSRASEGGVSEPSPELARAEVGKDDALHSVREAERSREAMPGADPVPPPEPGPTSARLAGTFLVDGRPLEWPLELTLETTAPTTPPSVSNAWSLSPQSFVLPPETRGEFSFTLPLDWRGRLTVEGYTFLDGTFKQAFDAPEEGLVLHLTGKPQIVGRLLEADGSPAGGVELVYELALEGNGTSSSSAVTLADGRFRIRSRPYGERGTLALVAAADARGWLQLATDPFDPRAGLDLGDLVLEPVRERPLTARSSDGTALRGACARIEIERPSIACTSATNAAGQGTLFLPERNCTLRVSAFGHADQVVTVSTTDSLDFELAKLALLALSIDAPEAAALSLRAERAAFVWDPADGPDWEFQENAGAASWNERTPARGREPWHYRYKLGGATVLLLVGLVPEQTFELELFDDAGRSLAVRTTQVAAGARAALTLGSATADGGR